MSTPLHDEKERQNLDRTRLSGLGETEADAGIWLVIFMHYAFGVYRPETMYHANNRPSVRYECVTYVLGTIRYLYVSGSDTFIWLPVQDLNLRLSVYEFSGKNAVRRQHAKYIIALRTTRYFLP